MGLCMEHNDDTLIARLSGELDHHSARIIREQVDAAVEKAKPKQLQLDFSGIGFMDSSGIGLIMGRFRLMQLYGGTLEVVGTSERVLKVMRLAGLDRLGIIREGSLSKEA